MDLRELETIAERELLKHGLHDWSFGWARTKRRQGACNYQSKRIEIAEYYATHNLPEKVLDTLLHEIAHALAGPKARHGPAWKAVAKKLGASPRTYDTCRETVVIPGDWQATCHACNKTHHKYKRPQSLTGYRCRCAARMSLSFQFLGDPALQPGVPMTIEQSAVEGPMEFSRLGWAPSGSSSDCKAWATRLTVPKPCRYCTIRGESSI